MEQREVVVIGAGAAGLFCAAQSGLLGQDVLLIDQGKKPGRKILMSGGGRCNFTNININANAYLSQNPHFCKSALARYSQWDFIALINQYNVAYHEKKLGQLFCDHSAKDIMKVLINECEKGNVTLRMRTNVLSIEAQQNSFVITLDQGRVQAKKVVIATGGLSMADLGSTGFAYQIAEQFGLAIITTRSGLTPLTLDKPLRHILQTLAGISLPITVTTQNGINFSENLLFTHRGLSGPAILQISNYWLPGENIRINLLPESDIELFLNTERENHPDQSLKHALAKKLPKRLTDVLQQLGLITTGTLKQLNATQQTQIINNLQNWQIQPNGTEGYRTAEITLGGVDTRCLSSKTMEVTKVPGLYFIGEAVDVTGWLGGYNLQWAWSSAWVCAQALSTKL